MLAIRGKNFLRKYYLKGIVQKLTPTKNNVCGGECEIQRDLLDNYWRIFESHWTAISLESIHLALHTLKGNLLFSCSLDYKLIFLKNAIALCWEPELLFIGLDWMIRD